MANIHWRNFKIFFSLGQIRLKFGKKHPWVKRIQVCSNKGSLNCQKTDNNFFLLISIKEIHIFAQICLLIRTVSQMSGCSPWASWSTHNIMALYVIHLVFWWYLGWMILFFVSHPILVCYRSFIMLQWAPGVVARDQWGGRPPDPRGPGEETGRYGDQDGGQESADLQDPAPPKQGTSHTKLLLNTSYSF